MASKIKKQIQDEIFKNIKYFTPTQQALLKGLYDKIDTYDNDTDIVNTVWANKDLPLRMISNKDLSEMLPGLSNLLIGEPRTGEVNLEKAFGKDWVSNFENIPYNQIALVAEKNGVDPNKLLYTMRDMATAQRREDIAHGRWDSNDPWYTNVANEIGGTALNLFGKRQQEAIARGEDPSLKDYGLDIGQSALEAVPYGRLAKLAKAPTLLNAAAYGGSVAAAPIVTEIADANLYEDSNPRGQFDPYEVMTGIGTNLVGDVLLRGGGNVADRVFGGKFGKRMLHLGEGESLSESLAKDLKNIDHQIANNEALMIRNSQGRGVGTRIAGSNEQRAAALKAEQNLNKLKYDKQVLEEVDYRYNNNKARDKVYGKNGHSTVPEHLRNLNRPKAGMSDAQLTAMTNDPNLAKYLRIDVEPGLTEGQLLRESALRTLITNKYGSLQNEQGKALTRLPFGIGPVLQKYIDEQERDEALRKAYEDVYNQYRFDILGGN